MSQFSRDFNPGVPTVSELTGLIKDLLESSFRNVEVEGEVSQPSRSANGHVYFTLKDSRAQMPCVIWRTAASSIGFMPEHGQQLVLSGDIQVYPPHGRYQFIVKSARQAGLGALQQAFEKLKKKLEAEGLFDPLRKKKLPAFPKVAGVVTSAGSAALQDMISTLKQRYPLLKLLVYHASVQGAGAASEIVRGINYFSGRDDVDVVVIGRGGGSLEDLWPFNEEIVARAIFSCEKPLISAVGHETDFSISDFVADVRAATPTQAISLMAPDINELRFQVDDLSMLLLRRMSETIRNHRQRVDALAKTHALHAVLGKMQQYINRVDTLTEKAINTIGNQITENKRTLMDYNGRMASKISILMLRQKMKYDKLNGRLHAVNPDEPLSRGFSRIWQNSQWVKSSGAFAEGKPFEIQWKDGKKAKGG